ncbi:MAG: nitrous oxide reductase accessory protein NosL [Reichenbachiella sp.]|uniref:nitrous oxide reductase accessory protein NosL n=1 Tax=Reichenbachiella sp. TaxID=2184521 RepID=UPI00326459A5
MIRPTLYIFALLLFLTQCTIETEPINYGTDSCHFCKMTIVDQQHAAQIVTKKGRNYKYDAIECMVNSLPQWKSEEIHTYLIADFSVPKKMIDATTAHYLIAEHMPSPMGAFLSGFENETIRNQYAKSEKDQTLNWSELQKAIAKK